MDKLSLLLGSVIWKKWDKNTYILGLLWESNECLEYCHARRQHSIKVLLLLELFPSFRFYVFLFFQLIGMPIFKWILFHFLGSFCIFKSHIFSLYNKKQDCLNQKIKVPVFFLQYHLSLRCSYCLYIYNFFQSSPFLFLNRYFALHNFQLPVTMKMNLKRCVSHGKLAVTTDLNVQKVHLEHIAKCLGAHLYLHLQTPMFRWKERHFSCQRWSQIGRKYSRTGTGYFLQRVWTNKKSQLET